jgi:electron transport complex protein RnfD
MRGYNIFNPVLVGLVVVFVFFPELMAGFSAPSASVMAVDAKTTATPLALLKQDGMGRLLEVYHTKADLYIDLLLGNRPGALGETSVAALLLGGLFLVKRQYVSWHIPVSFIATLGALMWIFGGKEGLLTGEPIFHILSGGLVLGAFFLATDRATVPAAPIDQVLFGIGCGALTALFRLKTGYPEGVMFAILIMNAMTPLLEKRIHIYITPRRALARVRKRRV